MIRSDLNISYHEDTNEKLRLRNDDSVLQPDAIVVWWFVCALALAL